MRKLLFVMLVMLVFDKALALQIYWRPVGASTVGTSITNWRGGIDSIHTNDTLIFDSLANDWYGDKNFTCGKVITLPGFHSSFNTASTITTTAGGFHIDHTGSFMGGTNGTLATDDSIYFGTTPTIVYTTKYVFNSTSTSHFVNTSQRSIAADLQIGTKARVSHSGAALYFMPFGHTLTMGDSSYFETIGSTVIFYFRLNPIIGTGSTFGGTYYVEFFSASVTDTLTLPSIKYTGNSTVWIDRSDNFGWKLGGNLDCGNSGSFGLFVDNESPVCPFNTKNYTITGNTIFVGSYRASTSATLNFDSSVVSCKSFDGSFYNEKSTIPFTCNLLNSVWHVRNSWTSGTNLVVNPGKSTVRADSAGTWTSHGKTFATMVDSAGSGNKITYADPLRCNSLRHVSGNIYNADTIYVRDTALLLSTDTSTYKIIRLQRDNSQLTFGAGTHPGFIPGAKIICDNSGAKITNSWGGTLPSIIYPGSLKFDSTNIIYGLLPLCQYNHNKNLANQNSGVLNHYHGPNYPANGVTPTLQNMAAGYGLVVTKDVAPYAILRFNGSNSYIDLGNNVSYSNNQFEVMVWLSQSNFTGTQVIFSHYLDVANRLEVYTSGGSIWVVVNKSTNTYYASVPIPWAANTPVMLRLRVKLAESVQTNKVKLFFENTNLNLPAPSGGQWPTSFPNLSTVPQYIGSRSGSSVSLNGYIQGVILASPVMGDSQAVSICNLGPDLGGEKLNDKGVLYMSTKQNDKGAFKPSFPAAFRRAFR